MGFASAIVSIADSVGLPLFGGFADRFNACAIWFLNRPYKRGKTLSEAIRIMGFTRRDQHVDPELFELFLTSGVYRDYAQRFLRPEQIDAIDVSALTASTAS